VCNRLRCLHAAGDLWLLLSTGFVYGVLQWSVAGWLGPQLPCLLAGGGAMLYYICVEKRHSIWQRLCSGVGVGVGVGGGVGVVVGGGGGGGSDDEDADAEVVAAPSRSPPSPPAMTTTTTKTTTTTTTMTSWHDALHARAYAIPFALLIIILLVYGVVPGVEEALTGDWDSSSSSSDSSSSTSDTDTDTQTTRTQQTSMQILSPRVWYIDESDLQYERRFPYLYHSAMVVLLCGLLTPYIVSYTKPSPQTLSVGSFEHAHLHGVTSARRGQPTIATSVGRDGLRRSAATVLRSLYVTACFRSQLTLRQRRRSTLSDALTESLHDVLPVVVSIASFASLAKLMGAFGMTTAIAEALVSTFADASAVYVIVCQPLIGMLGSALTGSTTTSNFLFVRLQVATAIDLNLVTTTRNSVWEVSGLQILGATAGEMISPMNAVVITLMNGVAGVYRESDLIYMLLPIAGVWLLLCSMISFVFMIPESSFFD
jgi:hypothetical protein